MRCMRYLASLYDLNFKTGHSVAGPYRPSASIEQARANQGAVVFEEILERAASADALSFKENVWDCCHARYSKKCLRMHALSNVGYRNQPCLQQPQHILPPIHLSGPTIHLSDSMDSRCLCIYCFPDSCSPLDALHSPSLGRSYIYPQGK